MNKKLLRVALLVAVVAVAGLGIHKAQAKKTTLSDIMLANVEALSDKEADSPKFAWSIKIDCPNQGFFPDTYQVCEMNGPGNLCSEPGHKTCECGVNCDKL